jgi:hypothetical protein
MFKKKSKNKWNELEKESTKHLEFGVTKMNGDCFLFHLFLGLCVVMSKNKKIKIYNTIKWNRIP